MDSIIEIYEHLEAFKKVFVEEEKKLPYYINLIDEVGANENGHTKILVKLLQYKSEGENIILNSFLTQFVGKDLELKDQNVHYNYFDIDCLIESKSYAVIIENKIHWAIDQYRQIERYFEKLEKEFTRDNIYVIYLTKDGQKKVSESSLSLDFKEKNLGDRFITINYRHDILPWLKEQQQICSSKETNLISSLTQYIDHLEGMLYLRKDKSEMNDKLITKIKDKLKISQSFSHEDYKKLIEHQENLQEYSLRLDNFMRDLVEDIKDKIIKELRDNEVFSPLSMGKTEVFFIINQDIDAFYIGIRAKCMQENARDKLKNDLKLKTYKANDGEGEEIGWYYPTLFGDKCRFFADLAKKTDLWGGKDNIISQIVKEAKGIRAQIEKELKNN